MMIEDGGLLAWHFVTKDTMRDGTPTPADGVTLSIGEMPEICVRGFHASERLFDALSWVEHQPYNLTSQELFLARVLMGGCMFREEDKMVAETRTILWRVPAMPLLCQFVYDQICHMKHRLDDGWGCPEFDRHFIPGRDVGDVNIRLLSTDLAVNNLIVGVLTNPFLFNHKHAIRDVVCNFTYLMDDNNPWNSRSDFAWRALRQLGRILGNCSQTPYKVELNRIEQAFTMAAKMAAATGGYQESAIR